MKPVPILALAALLPLATAQATRPPVIASLTPADEAIKVDPAAALSVAVNDPDGGPLAVTLHGRRVGGVDPTGAFTVVALPDTQFYSQNSGGTRAALFSAQTDWIVAERDARNIGFVLHLGDITQYGDRPDTALAEWTNASNAMYRLEDPVTGGVPYIMAVGNHDQTPIGDADGTTTHFNTYFGVHPQTGINHFASRDWYGGTSVPDSADNNYTLFTAGGLDFIVISLEYDTTPDAADLAWADALLKAHPARRGIVITHHMVNTGFPANFSAQGTAIYQALKDNPNLMLLHGGHVAGEGRRSDTHDGRVVHSLLADYQSRGNGGDGWLRLMKFIPTRNRIEVSTYSPVLDAFETDADSQFALDVNLKGGVGPFHQAASASAAPGTVSLPWPDLEPGTRYEWYATVSDGTSTATTPVRSFITAGVPFPPVVEISAPANGSVHASAADVSFQATASDLDGSVAKVDYYAGTSKLGEAVSPPYAFTWQDVPPGSHTVLAKATDDEGNASFSVPVAVQVIAAPPVPDVSTVSAGRFNAGWTVVAGSPAPLGFTSPGSNNGDIALRVNGNAVPFLSGVIATANWENTGNSGVDSIDNLAMPYADGSGNAWVNVYDHSNPNAAESNPKVAEESAGTAVARFPYAAGWTGASVGPEGEILGGNLPAGTTVRRIGSGLYAIHGLATTGNLLAFPNGNGGTDGDNVLSVLNTGDQWRVDVRDNAGDPQAGSFTILHIPAGTPGVLSGMIRSDGSLVALNERLEQLGATVVKTGSHFELTFGDGTAVRSLNAALFLTGDTSRSGAAGDNILSYSSAGNVFRIFSQDLPELSGTFQATDVRFVAVPFSLAAYQAPLPAVSVTTGDGSGGEFGEDSTLSFILSRDGPTGAPLTVSFATSGGAQNGIDYTGLTGTAVIPAGQSSVTVTASILTDDAIEGPETLRLILLPNSSYAFGETTSTEAIIADRPFHAFLHTRGATEAGDGTHLLDYYHGQSTAGALRAVSSSHGVFRARFPRSKEATDVTAAAEWSTDLSHWHRDGESNGTQQAAIELLPVSPPEDDPETVEAVLTVTEGPVPPSIYLRLVVTP